MADFNKQLPEWNDPGIDPPQQLKDEGWRIAQRPPASYFDWLFYTTYQALKELQEKAASTTLTGALASLTTTVKTSLVAAINEIKSKADANTTDIGTKASLTTTAKTNLVAAINELDAEHGALSGLNTTAKSTLVGAINEVNTAASNAASAAGAAQTSANTANAAAGQNEIMHWMSV